MVSGCSGKTELIKVPNLIEKTVNIETAVPTNFLICRDIPKEPTGDYDNEDVSNYILELYDTAAECKGNLHKIDQIINEDQNRSK